MVGVLRSRSLRRKLCSGVANQSVEAPEKSGAMAAWVSAAEEAQEGFGEASCVSAGEEAQESIVGAEWVNVDEAAPRKTAETAKVSFVAVRGVD